MSETRIKAIPLECVAAEFGEGDNQGLVAFWVKMSDPRLCKVDADLITASFELHAALEDVQWSNGGFCPQCCNGSLLGHQPKCLIGTALAHARGESA